MATVAAGLSGSAKTLRKVGLGRIRFPGQGMGLLLTGGTILIAVAAMVVATYLDVDARRDDARDGLRERGNVVANAASTVLYNSLRAKNVQELGDLAVIIWSQPDIAYVNIFAADGEWLVGPLPRHFPPRGTFNEEMVAGVADLLKDAQFRDEHLEVVAPVVTPGAELVGAVQFGFDTASIDDEVNDLTRNRILETVALAAIAIGFSFFLVRYFVRPITVLLHATERLARGDLKTRVARLHGREMGGLGEAFNAMAEELDQKVADLQDSRSRIVSGEERVRREIADHLHGDVQGRLLGLRAKIGQVANRPDLAAQDSQELLEIMEEMRQVTQEKIAVLSRELYPGIVNRGLVPSLQSLGDRFESGLNIEISVDDALRERERRSARYLPEMTRMAAYRITNEALGNALKHCPGCNVWIDVEATGDGCLNLSIRDDGAGFDSSIPSDGLGLRTMLDYSAAAGGTCTVESEIGRGTLVSAKLPLATNGDAPA